MDSHLRGRAPGVTRDRSRIAKAWPLAVLILAVNLATGRASAGHGPSAIAPADRSGPKVSVDKEQHDFGKSDGGVGGHHAFVFTNTGDEPLVLTRGKSTCGCCTCVCTVRLPDAAVAPGESADVTLEWQSKLFVGSFRQTAAILTNDPLFLQNASTLFAISW